MQHFSAILITCSIFLIYTCNLSAQVEIEIGAISCNKLLCELVGWKSNDRNSIAAKYTAAQVNAAKLKNPESVSAYISSVQFHINDDVRKYSTAAYLVSNGPFAVTRQLVSENYGISPSDREVMSKYLRQLQNEIKDKVVSTIDSSKFTSYDALKEAISSEVDAASGRMSAEIKRALPKAAFDRFIFDLNTSLNMPYPSRYSDIKSAMLIYISNELLKKDTIFGKPPLVMPASLLIVMSSDEVLSHIFITEDESLRFAELYSTTIAGYRDALQAYHNTKSNSSKDIIQANVLFSKTISQFFKTSDDRLRQLLGERRFGILTKINKQVCGPSTLFINNSDQSNGYDFSAEQYRMKLQLLGKLTSKIADSSIQNTDFVKKATAIIEYNRAIYSDVLTEQQRKQWDESIGVKLSDDQILSILVHRDKLLRSK